MIKLKTDRLTHLGAIAVDVGKESVLKEQLTLSLRFSSRLLCCSGLCQGDPLEEGKWSRSPSVAASKQRDGKAGRGRSPLKARPWWSMSPSQASPPGTHQPPHPFSHQSQRLSLSHMYLWGTFDIKVMLHATRNKEILQKETKGWRSSWNRTFM